MRTAQTAMLCGLSARRKRSRSPGRFTNATWLPQLSKFSWGTMADEFEALADSADYYRKLASIIRSRGPSMKSPEARDELSARTEYYEILAKYAESTATRSTLMGRLSEQQE